MDKNERNSVYFISGGGTGGHIYPAIAVINELKKHGEKNIYYIGNPKNPEYIIARDNHINFLPVNINGMPRKISFSSILWIFKLIRAIIVCILYIHKYKPSIIFGTGGYVSAPILFAARFMKIPYAMHDADAQPGIVTRCFSSGAIVLTSPFNSVKEILPATNIEITGNPIRDDFSLISKEEAREKSGLENKLTLLVMGGSQGARSINNAIIPIAKKLIDEFNICILHQSGKNRYEEAVGLLQSEFKGYENCKDYKLFPYIDDMPPLLKSADIAISRSGSLSLSEMKACGIASVLIPYPYSAGGHQKKNAQAMVNEGCSVMIDDFELTPEKLYEVLSNILSNPEKLHKMQEKALENSMPYATKNIAERLINFNE